MADSRAFRSNSFAYKDYPIAHEQFRLLILTLGEDSSAPPHGQLAVHTIAASPAYFTLSYAWGDVQKTKSLQLLQHSSTISSTVENALCTLRSLGVRRIWIDQVCIDQQNTLERNHQVIRMKDIYANAKECFVFLQSIPHHIDEADDGVDAQVLRAWVDDFREQIKENTGLDRVRSCSTDKPTSLFRGSSPLYQHAQRYMYGVMEPRYFTRLWVLQDIVLSRRITFLVGLVEILWYVIRALAMEMPRRKLYSSNAAARHLGLTDTHFLVFNELKNVAHVAPTEQDERRASALDQFSTFAEMTDSLKSGGRKMSLTLSSLLTGTRTFQTTDPRDKIYALLGMACDQSEYPQPDYSRFAVEVYESFARCFARQGRAAWILTCSGLHQSC